MDQPKTKTKNPLAKRMKIMIIILIVVFGGIFAFNILRHVMMKRFFANFTPPPVTISSTKATAKTWEPFISSIGTLVAIDGVQVSPQVGGTVMAIKFESGQMAKAGTPLVQIDDRTDQEDLKSYQAQLKLDELNYQRQINLIKTKATSQSSVDSAQAQLEQSKANVAKTLILIAQKNIEAPFDGKLGIRQVNLGQYVSPGTALVSLQSLNPMYVQFSLPEHYLKSLYVDQPVQVTVTTNPKEIFQGKINAIDSTSNAQTHNILVQAVLPNDQFHLYPGMFANIKVMLPTQENVITVPQTAVSFSLYGDSIFVIKQEGKDEKGNPILKTYRRYITTGDRQGNEVAILKGISANEEVVTSGQLKLDDGTHVVINNSVTLPEIPENTLQENQQ